MKKNVMMRVASVLLICVLLTSSVISGTFAKYVTKGTGTDSARVAHFGVVVTADSDMFDTQYKGVETGWDAKMTVVSTTTDNLVAPGTTKTMANVKVTGIPEVAVRISNDVENFDIGDNWVVGGAFYCPIVITVWDAKGEEHNISGLKFDNPTDFEDAVIAAIETATAEYAPHFDLNTLDSANVLKVTWAWAFEGSNTPGDLTYGQDDVKDTALGDAAVKGTIDISVTTYVTQID